MCDPLSLTAVGLAVAGGASNFVAQQQQSAMNDATSQYDSQYAAQLNSAEAQQQEQQAKAGQIFNSSLTNATPQNQAAQTAQQQAQLAGQYSNATAGTLDQQQQAAQGSKVAQAANPNNATANQIIGSGYKQAADNVAAYTGQQANAKAALDAYTGQNANNAIFNIGANNQLSSIGAIQNNIAQNNQTQLGLDNMIYQNNMQDAKSKGGIFTALGTVLGGASHLAGAGAGLAGGGGGIFEPSNEAGGYLSATATGNTAYPY